MADFTLYDGDLAENSISFLPQLKNNRLIDFQMYLCENKNNIEDKTEYILSFNYVDVLLLRDYLSSVINLFEKSATNGA